MKANYDLPKKENLFFKIISFRLILFLMLLIWCTGFSLYSFFPKSNEVLVFSPVIKKIYSAVCYQNEIRSFTISGKKLFVCERCTGIYLGALLFSFISIFVKHLKLNDKILLASFSAIVSDVVIYSAGIFNYSKYYAFVTGFFFGSSAFLYILIILENEFFVKE